MTQPAISVVICTYNRCNLLRNTLMAFAGLPGTDQAEIVLIDNNSSDETKRVTEECRSALESIIPVTYVHEPRQGLSIARNTGVETAKGEIIAFLDDDAIPSRRWLTGMIDFFAAHHDAMAAGGPIEPNFEIARPVWLAREIEGPYTILNLGDDIREFSPGSWPYGASMAFRGSAIRKHGFPEHLGRKGNLLLSNEETYVLRKIKAEGGRVYYLPDMHVLHFVPKERLTKDWIRDRYFHGGVSKAFEAENRAALVKLFALTVLKRLYLAIRTAARVQETSLLDECRLKSCKGAFQGIGMRWKSPSP